MAISSRRHVSHVRHCAGLCAGTMSTAMCACISYSGKLGAYIHELVVYYFFPAHYFNIFYGLKKTYLLILITIAEESICPFLMKNLY
jgi:hypothetical protein